MKSTGLIRPSSQRYHRQQQEHDGGRAQSIPKYLRCHAECSQGYTINQKEESCLSNSLDNLIEVACLFLSARIRVIKLHSNKKFERRQTQPVTLASHEKPMMSKRSNSFSWDFVIPNGPTPNTGWHSLDLVNLPISLRIPKPGCALANTHIQRPSNRPHNPKERKSQVLT